MVVSAKHPLRDCPHISQEVLDWAEKELEEQYRQGKWLKKDMAVEALQLAEDKIATEDLQNIGERIGGKMKGEVLLLPYFNSYLYIDRNGIQDEAGNELSRNEQTFVYIHMSMMNKAEVVKPTGNVKSFKEFPNTISKVVSMRNHVEEPLQKAFSGNLAELEHACLKCGGINVKAHYTSPNLAFYFQIFPLMDYWVHSNKIPTDSSPVKLTAICLGNIFGLKINDEMLGFVTIDADNNREYMKGGYTGIWAKTQYDSAHLLFDNFIISEIKE
jgi:hypothetical protein